MTSAAAPPGFTILRIKRKITEDPLESLLIDDSYRPKKRSKEVSGQSKGVFRLADTVAEGWEEGTGGEALRSKIARLLSSQPPSSPSPASFPSASSAPSPPAHPQPHLRYRIIAPPSQPRPSSRRAPTAPPVIQTTLDPSLPPPLKYIDAHPVIVVPTSNFQAQVGGNLILPPAGREEEEDPDVAAFLPMLREYLAVSNPIPSSFSNTTSSTPTQISTPTPSAPDQYVYDLYYHSLSTHPSPNSAEASMVARATVEGYIAEGEEELMVESDDEEESDEVDEDSNDEDFYRNDYPEEEAGDSEDSYGDGIGSGAEERWEEDY